MIDDAHHAPALVKASPFFAMLLGFVVAYWFYIVDPTRPAALARIAAACSTASCSTSGTSTRSTTSSSCGRRAGSAPSCGRAATARVIDGILNGVAMGIVPWFTRLAGRWQSGYLFHYAFAMVIGLVFLTLWLGLGIGR